MTSRLRLLLALFAALSLLLAACNGDDTGGEGDGQTPEGEEAGEDLGLAQPGTMVVGSDIAFAPFEFIEDGEIRGFDIDLMDEIAERLGVEVEYVNTAFDTLFTQLAGGEFDAAISAITITEEREETVDFSDPYFQANQALAVPADSDIESVDDLADQQVAVQAATTGADYAQENFTEATIVDFPTSEAAFAALQAGQVDAVFIDIPVVQERVDAGDQVEIAEEVNTDEEYGIAVQPGNDALLDAINEQLQAIIDDGTYEEIFSTWFPDAEVPEDFRADG